MKTISINGVMVDGSVGTNDPMAAFLTGCTSVANAIATCTDDLTLQINSFGGSVEGSAEIAIALTDWICANPDKKIKVEIGAICASAAANLVARLPRQATILIHPESFIMYHSCSGLVEGSPDELRDNAARMDAINDLVKDALRKRTTLDSSKIDSWFMAGREGWLSGLDAVNCGLADGFINDGFEPAPIIPEDFETNKYNYAAIAAIASKCKELRAMDEEKKEVIETEIEKPETEVIEEKKEEVIEEPTKEIEVEKEIEKTEEAECDKDAEISALKAENEELKAEIEELKATCEKLTSGLKAPTAKAEVKKTFAELIKAIPTNLSEREFAKRFTALKEEHKAEYKAYMDAHQRH